MTPGIAWMISFRDLIEPREWLRWLPTTVGDFPIFAFFPRSDEWTEKIFYVGYLETRRKINQAIQNFDEIMAMAKTTYVQIIVHEQERSLLEGFSWYSAVTAKSLEEQSKCLSDQGDNSDEIVSVVFSPEDEVLPRLNCKKNDEFMGFIMTTIRPEPLAILALRLIGIVRWGHKEK